MSSFQSKSISTKRNLLNHLLHQTASPGAVADMLMNFPAVAISLASLRTASAFRSAASFRLRSLSAHSLSGGNNSYTHTSTRFNHNRYYFASSSSLQQASTGNNMYWNRDNCKPNAFKNEPITQEARILALCDPTDAFNQPLYDGPLPEGAKLLKVGTTLSDFDEESIIEQKPNVIFVSHLKAREPLVEILNKFPSLEWSECTTLIACVLIWTACVCTELYCCYSILLTSYYVCFLFTCSKIVHTRSAGIDFISSDGLFSSKAQLTNAKGMFSSTLAEYCMMACSYFAKDLPRLMQQKKDVNWDQYPVLELRSATLGVIGYGDIGRASAKLAKAYGMKVLGLKRNAASFSDPYCDEVYGMDGLDQVMAQSDYILISAPLTEQTKGLISKEALSKCKKSAVIINVGRGPIIDEEALIEVLQNGTIKGAGLDVMTIEPLPKESPLWKLDNVLLSPHNMDMTLSFMKESTEFFIAENLPRFVRGQQLLNPVDKTAGY